MSKIIGLCGSARAGKDTFCKFLISELAKKGVYAKRFALADELKKALEPFLKEHFNVSTFTDDAKEKQLIRPLLVEFGRAKRILTEGTYWTNILESQMASDDSDIKIVTDIRYHIYPKDELYWVRQHLKGILVYIDRYDIVDGEKVFIPPPNKDEAENNPRLKAVADYIVEWKTEPIDKLENLIPYVSKFIDEKIR